MNDKAIRAWKDPKYRASLSAEELGALPANPAGQTWHQIDQDELSQLIGGASSQMPAPTVRPISNCGSCGYLCTATTECPILSFCCAQA